MVGTINSSSVPSNSSSGAAQSANSAQSAQTIQTIPGSLESMLSNISADLAKITASGLMLLAASGLIQADIKQYLPSQKIKVEDAASKTPGFYKKEMQAAIEASQKNSKRKYAEADVITSSNKAYGTMAPVNPNSNKPVNLGNTTQFLMAIFKDTIDSMAFNAGFFKSLSYRMLEAIFGFGTDNMLVPSYNGAC